MFGVQVVPSMMKPDLKQINPYPVSRYVGQSDIHPSTNHSPRAHMADPRAVLSR